MSAFELCAFVFFVFYLPYYWRVELPARRRKRLEREQEQLAYANRSAAQALYPVMGPDYLWQVLGAHERATNVQERAELVAQAAEARMQRWEGRPPMPPTIPTEAELQAAFGATTPTVGATRFELAPESTPLPPPSAHSAPPHPKMADVVQVVFNEPRTATPIDDAPAPGGGPHFEPGEPTTLGEYVGQHEAKLQLGDAIQALAAHECAAGTWVFLGPAGLGKTALMRAFGNTLRLRNLHTQFGETAYVEVFPADIASRDDLERVLKRVRGQPAVLQVDEIHTLDPEFAVVLYELFERRRYQFAGAPEAVTFTQLTLVSATTDFALCHPALRSRLTKVFLQRVPPADMVAALRLRPFPATDAALEAIVSRTHHGGVMRDVVEVYKQTVVSAKARGARQVEVQDVERVWHFNRVDEHGLQEPERAVIRALLRMPRVVRGKRGDPDVTLYVGSESNVTQVAGVDMGAYRMIHRPRLMQRGLLTTASSGQQLTPRALALYGNLA